jgi:hypothetical protein
LFDQTCYLDGLFYQTARGMGVAVFGYNLEAETYWTTEGQLIVDQWIFDRNILLNRWRQKPREKCKRYKHRVGKNCILNKCTCLNGKAASATNGGCAVHGGEECTACNSGYTLNGQVCISSHELR